jgi:nitrogen fixation NifU-like protein
MDDLYQEQILAHYRHPHHGTPLPSYTHRESGANPSCGDELELYLSLDGDQINDVGFGGSGCAISTAAMSMLADRLIGMSRSEALAITEGEVARMLGVVVGPQRSDCANLGLRTLYRALGKDNSAMTP